MAGPGSTSPPPGADTEVPWLSDEEQQAWIGLLGITLKLPALLDTQLQRESGIGTFDYIVLSYLSMAEGRMLRMSSLAELANGSLSRLSNVVKRLEQMDWVRRQPDPVDGRYTVAALTDAGWNQVVAAAPGHVKAVRHLVMDPLTSAQIRQLSQIGRRIVGQLRTGLPSAGETPCAGEAPCAGEGSEPCSSPEGGVSTASDEDEGLPQPW